MPGLWAVTAVIVASVVGAPLPSPPPPPTSVLLMGDSVAASMEDAVITAGEARGYAMYASTRPGCGMTDGVTLHTTDAAGSRLCAGSAADYRRSAPKASAVLILSTWDSNDFLVGGETLLLLSPDWKKWMGSQLLLFAEEFEAPIFILTIPARGRFMGNVTQPVEEQVVLAEVNAWYRKFAAAHADTVGVVEFATMVCGGSTDCPEYVDRFTPRPDLGTHFDAAGAAWVAPQVLDGLLVQWNRMHSTP